MKHRLRRGTSALLAAMILGQGLPAALAVPARLTLEEAIAITAEIFPDAAFRTWLKDPANISGYGTDGILTSEELAQIRAIDVANQNLTTLQGIEVFSALESLDCKNTG